MIIRYVFDLDKNWNISKKSFTEKLVKKKKTKQIKLTSVVESKIESGAVMKFVCKNL